MADVEEKPREVQDAGDAGGRDTAPVKDDREFMSVDDARKAEADKVDPKKQEAESTRLAKEGATTECCKDVGSGKDIAENPVVKKNIEANKSHDPSAKLDKNGTLSFDNSVLAGTGLENIAGKSGDKLSMAKSLNVGDQKFEAPTGKAAEKGQPGDNNVRDIDPAKDNPQAVQERYNSMIDGLNLPAGEAARMKEQYGKDMAKVQEKFKGDDLSHVMRSMNLMMDQNNQLGNDRNRVNAVSGLAARGANPQEANRQGANPTCALTSEARIEQQRDFVKYADQMGSVAAKGGAWRGGENGTQAMWVDVNAAGTNGANFQADRESQKMYDKDYHQTQGHRDYLGQLDNALIGGEMAKHAGQKDGKDYVYVAANAHKVDGADAFGQGNAGNTLMTRDANGNLAQARDGGQAVNSPPSTLDMVAKVNHANGGGGMMVQENLAAQFRRADGSYPPGMNVFKDAADLKQQLAANPNKEFQIATNGVIVAGREGHGLHAQTVQMKDGKLVFGNNWSDKDNNRTYSDDFVNKFTNPNQWNNYQPSHRNPDGTPDWKEERVGPKTGDIVKPEDSRDKKKEDEKSKEDEDKKKDSKNKEKEEEEAKKQADKQRASQKAQADYDQAVSEWNAEKAAHDAQHKDNKDAPEFSKARPSLKSGF